MGEKNISVRLRLSRGCFCQDFMVSGRIVGGVACGESPRLALVALDQSLSGELLSWIGSAAIGADLGHLLVRARPPLSEFEARVVIVDVFLRERGDRSASPVARGELRALGDHVCFTAAQARRYEEYQADWARLVEETRRRQT